MTATADRITRAFHRQKRGEVQPAIESVLSILQNEPHNVNALQFLGLIYWNMGRVAESDELISRAITLCPSIAELHNTRGLCRLSQNRLEESRNDFLEAIRLQPAYPEAFNNLGLAANRLGQAGEAEGAFIRAIRLKPDYATAFCNLAVTVLQQGRAVNAEASCRRAIALCPDYPEAMRTLGLALEQLNQLDETEAWLRRSLAVRPHALALTCLGRLLRRTGRAAEAVSVLHSALELISDSIEAHQELGFALLEQGKLTEAKAATRTALELGSDSSESQRLLGGVLRDDGQHSAAEACFRRALELSRDNANAHYDLSTLHLLTGRWKTGWKGYEWRRQCRCRPQLGFEQPMWDGSPLGGRTILVWCEDDPEDTMLFVRFTRLVKARGGRVILRGPVSLGPILRSEYLGADHVSLDSEPLPPFDTHAPLGSLPRILGTTLETVPAEIPYVSYLDLDAATWMFWQERLERFSGERVGIVWSAHESASGHRSVSPEVFAPLCSITGVSLISLQKHASTVQCPLGIGGLGFAFDESTWTDLIAVLSGLDLVISVDCAIAHLAGALGIPVWMAVSSAPDWRWLREREDSPWYPTMRLFRQPRAGDWDAVFQRLAGELKQWAKSRSSGTVKRTRRQRSEIDFTGAISLDYR